MNEAVVNLLTQVMELGKRELHCIQGVSPAIPRFLLGSGLKSKALSPDEWKIMKTHPILDYELIKQDTR